MKKEIKGFIVGLITASILLFSLTGLADTMSKNIEVVLNQVNLAINGKALQVDNILYNGTTYVPIRAVAESLGKEVGWSGQTNTASINDKGTTVASSQTTPATKPVVEITMANDKKMVVELYPEYAPQTVANFVDLAKSNFYDGLKFHRIIKDFMIQGGDPKGNGTGGSDKNIYGEFAKNGFTQNTLKHTKGVISMARSSMPNSASSQFFIMTSDSQFLDGNYAAFGKVIEGLDVLDELANTPVEDNYGELSKPKTDIVIKKITVVSSLTSSTSNE